MRSVKHKLFVGTLLSGAILAAGAASTFAQDNRDDDEVIVTGTLIQRSANTISNSPITEINAADFDARGVVQVEDMINTLPQAFGAQGSNLANGATGTSSLNLRGLGATRNLVLVNGKRLPYGSLNTASVDVNFIPSALVKEVQILTGGASATYGSDAISGVANFILDEEYEGVKLDMNYSFYQHNNDNGYIQDILSGFAANNPSQYEVPDGSVSDGDTYDITGVFGSGFADDRGHFTAYAGYQKTKKILQADRDYSQCSLSTANGGEDFSCEGSATNQFANILDISTGYVIPGTVANLKSNAWSRVNVGNGEFELRDFVTDTFNFNPYNHYQRPNERFTLGAFADYEINDKVTAYTELMFMDNETNSQIAPSGVFGLGVNGGSGGINCNNPFLSAQQVDYLCGEIADGAIDVYTNSEGEFTDAEGNVLPEGADPVARFDGIPDQLALGSDDIAPLLIFRRNVEGGSRNNDIAHTSFRILGGFKGDIGNTNLSYDVSGIYSRVRRSEVYNNDLSKTKIARALNAVKDADGNIICSVNADTDPTNDDPNCVPYDIFSPAGPSAAATAYLASPLLRNGHTEQTILNATLFGDFGKTFKSPYTDGVFSFAAGIEARRDELVSRPDAGFLSGDGAGQGGPTTGIDGSQEVLDIFGELDLPLVSDRPYMENLSLNLGYRYSDYTNNGNDVETDTSSDSYKITGNYAPIDDIRFRASYQRAVRAPNIFELFTAQSIGLFSLSSGDKGLHDPCAGEQPNATFEQCARTGVTREQYGSIADNPAGQFNNFGGGNPDLDPEKSDTFTIGFVAEPSFLDGLIVSVDYFDIEVDGFISALNESDILKQCLNAGDAFSCSLINRGSGGTLWANDTGFIISTSINTGTLSTSGIDFSSSYRFDVEALKGGFKTSYVGTWLDELITKPLPTSTKDQTYDCVGYYGAQCGAPNPEYRHKADLTFLPDSDRFTAQVTWRYYDSVDIATSSSQPALAGTGDIPFAEINKTLDSQNYIDLSGTFTPLDFVTFRAGVNNVFDEEPPLSTIVGTAPGNGNTYPQVYDAFGRYIFMGATFNFN